MVKRDSILSIFLLSHSWQPPVKNHEERPGFPASKPMDSNKGWFKKCSFCLLGGTFDIMFPIIFFFFFLVYLIEDLITLCIN